MRCRRDDPRHSLYFWDLGWMPVRSSNDEQWSDRQTQNTVKVENPGSAPLVTISWVSTFIFSTRIRIAESSSTQVQASWEPVTPPADYRMSTMADLNPLAYMGTTRSPLPQNQGKLPLFLFCGIFGVILHDFIRQNYHKNQSNRYPFPRVPTGLA